MRIFLTAALVTLLFGGTAARAQVPSMEVGSDAGAVHAADSTSSADRTDRAADVGAAAAPTGTIASMLTPDQLRAANEAMARLRSPVTAAHTVDMCPSVEALRDTIRVAAMTGMTTEAIVEDVVSRHGEHLRMLPKRRGAGLFAWVATPLVLLVGAGLIVARVRRGAAPEVPVGGDVPLSDEDRARLDEEIRALEEAP